MGPGEGRRNIEYQKEKGTRGGYKGYRISERKRDQGGRRDIEYQKEKGTRGGEKGYIISERNRDQGRGEGIYNIRKKKEPGEGRRDIELISKRNQGLGGECGRKDKVKGKQRMVKAFKRILKRKKQK